MVGGRLNFQCNGQGRLHGGGNTLADLEEEHVMKISGGRAEEPSGAQIVGLECTWHLQGWQKGQCRSGTKQTRGRCSELR